MHHQHVKEWRQRRLSLGADDSEIEAIDKIDIDVIVKASIFLCEAAAEKLASHSSKKEEDSVESAIELLLFLADKAVGIE